ncbi:MAG: hypothetical protein MUF54_12715 [Polyangiaceae bacterium]|nr:hypothetical protein [Polyangiaceae bacterium]
MLLTKGWEGDFLVLPPFIIDLIRKREDDLRRRGEQHQPSLELPQVPRPHAPGDADCDKDQVDRGVVVVDLG